MRSARKEKDQTMQLLLGRSVWPTGVAAAIAIKRSNGTASAASMATTPLIEVLTTTIAVLAAPMTIIPLTEVVTTIITLFAVRHCGPEAVLGTCGT